MQAPGQVRACVDRLRIALDEAFRIGDGPPQLGQGAVGLLLRVPEEQP